MTNFTQVDVCGTLHAVPYFALVFLCPGYCIGRASNVLDFRQRSPAEQWLWSMGISIAIMPIALNLLCRWLSIQMAVALCGALAVAACIDLLLRWRSSSFPVRVSLRRSTVVALSLAALWAIVCLCSLPDLQLGDRLYSSAAVADLGVRSSFVASAMHGGAPPANPFFYPGSIVNLRYYYYWYVVTALPGKAAGVEPRAALFASSIWSGWLLASVIALFLKYFYGVRHRLRAASVLGMALLGVTGLDAVYVLGLYLKYHIVLSDMEVWDTDQVTSWTNSLLWVPHHVAATSACMVSLVFLWHAGRRVQHSTHQRLLLATLAASGIASAAGLSVYVTFTFALFLLATSIYWLATRRFRIVGIYAAVATLALLMSVDYLRDLRAAGANEGSRASIATNSQHQSASQTLHPFPFKIALRQLPPTLGPVLNRAVHGSKVFNIALRPFLLVPVVFLELGFFFVVGARQGRSDWRKRKFHATIDPAMRDSLDIRNISWLMLATGLWVALMMRSTVILNNDLSYRGVELAQFILLIWGASQLAGISPATDLTMQLSVTHGNAHAVPPVTGMRVHVGWLAGSLLVLGLASSTYQLIMLRLYFWGADRYGWTNPVVPQSELTSRLGVINQQTRSAYATLDRLLPASAKVQFGAAPKLDLQLLYYSRYQQLDGMFPGCGTAFGGSEAECFRVSEQLAPIFGTSALPPTALHPEWQTVSRPVLRTAAEVRSICNDLGIDALIVTGEDPVWGDPNAWPHTMQPVYAADFVAAYTCR